MPYCSYLVGKMENSVEEPPKGLDLWEVLIISRNTQPAICGMATSYFSKHVEMGEESTINYRIGKPKTDNSFALDLFLFLDELKYGQE